MKKIALALMVAGSALMAADGAALYKKCISCHGAKGEKKALGNKSKVITGWPAAQTIESLKGYKAGKGGPMKALMKGQVASYSDADIEAVAKYIEGLK